MPRVSRFRSPGLRHLYDKFIAGDPDREALYQREFNREMAEHAANVAREARGEKPATAIDWVYRGVLVGGFGAFIFWLFRVIGWLEG